MPRLGKLGLMGGVLAVALVFALSCGREVPTRPAEPSALHLEAELWREGDVRAYSIEGRPNEIALRFIRIATTDAAGNRQLLTYSQALITLTDDAVVRAVSVWRIVPSHRGWSPGAAGKIRIGDEEFADRFSVQGTDPDPPAPLPLPEPCGGCCSGGDVSWGCLKCCYA